jgi:hypothetical protein|tara:strand:+ start:1713 stop:1946 length:234 start_codon:yes stop_codon:yes gene_type:complete
MAEKKNNITFNHNLYNVLGQTLLDGVQSGRLDPNKIGSLATANLGIDLGKGYGVDLGYNEYIGDRKQDLKINITKKF